jgi:HEPN superfamily RiboL-PSP-like protein
MTSVALQTFEHTIQDAIDLLNHFDTINKKPPPPEAEVLKRASLIMALAALETYIEDRIIEAVKAVADHSRAGRPATFYINSLEIDLKSFHTPRTDRIRALFDKYLGIDVTEGWTWNQYNPARARGELDKIARKRGDIAHRSWRPIAGRPTPHAVTREDLRKHIRFIRDLVGATDAYLAERL